MKNIKELYRKFTKNLIVYFAGEPTIEYQSVEYGEKGNKKRFEFNKSLNDQMQDGTRFAEKKTRAQEMIDKIDMDANPETKTQAEKDLVKKLSDHNADQFKVLEHNYNRAKGELGENWAKETSPMRKVEASLEKSTDDYVRALEAHIFSESMKQGDEVGRGLIIEQYLQDRGIDVRGLGKYIARKINFSEFGTQTKSREEITKVLETKITKEILKAAIKEMQNDLPKVKYTAEKSAYFHKLFDSTMKDGDNRLTRVFGSGKDNESRNLAASVLAKRFDIEWMTTEGKTDTTKPVRITDLTTMTAYKPDSAEFMEKLRDICHTEITDQEEMAKQNNGLEKIQKERDAKFNELDQGTWWLDNEANGISDLKDNPVLNDVLMMTNVYQDRKNEGVNAAVGRLKRLSHDSTDNESGKAIDNLSQSVRKNGSGFGELIEGIIKLIEALKGKPEELKKVKSDIDSKRNPVEESKKESEKPKEAKKFFNDTLNSENPELDILLSDEKIDEIFTKKAGEGQKGLAEKFKDEKTAAIADYLGTKLEVKDLKIEKNEQGYTLTFKIKDIDKTYGIEKKEEGKILVQDSEAKNATEIEFTVEALKNAINQQPEKKEEPKQSEADKAKDILLNMVSGNFKKVSPLGKLIIDLDLKKEFGEQDKKLWQKGKNSTERQNLLDTARAEFIVSKMTGDSPITIQTLAEKSKDFDTQLKAQPNTKKEAEGEKKDVSK